VHRHRHCIGIHATRRHAVASPVDLLATFWSFNTELIREARQEVFQAQIQPTEVCAGRL